MAWIVTRVPSMVKLKSYYHFALSESVMAISSTQEVTRSITRASGFPPPLKIKITKNPPLLAALAVVISISKTVAVLDKK